MVQHIAVAKKHPAKISEPALIEQFYRVCGSAQKAKVEGVYCASENSKVSKSPEMRAAEAGESRQFRCFNFEMQEPDGEIRRRSKGKSQVRD